MFREKIKVLDCTIRDGGLINNHDFDIRFVREVYKALSLAGVDYMEIGYKNSKKLFSPKEFGKWKFCDDDDINRVIEGIESKTKISVLVDAAANAQTEVFIQAVFVMVVIIGLFNFFVWQKLLHYSQRFRFE